MLTRGHVAILAHGVYTMQATTANISVPAPCTALQREHKLIPAVLNRLPQLVPHSKLGWDLRY